MAAQEHNQAALGRLPIYPYVFVDRIRISRPTALGGHSMPVLMAIGTDGMGAIGMVGATVIVESLEQAWEKLLGELRGSGRQGVRLFVSAAPEPCQSLALRLFPTARWQSPLKSFYERVLQTVPPVHASDIARMLQAVHEKDSRVDAEHAAAEVVGALTAIGLWETGISFAGSYHHTLTYFEFPAHLRRSLRDNGAFDTLIDSFIAALASTGQFRGCSIRRMSQFETDTTINVPPVARTVEVAPAARIKADIGGSAPVTPAPIDTATVSRDDNVRPAPADAVASTVAIAPVPVMPSAPVYEEIELTDPYAPPPSTTVDAETDDSARDLAEHPFGRPLLDDEDSSSALPPRDESPRMQPAARRRDPPAPITPPRLQWRTRLSSVPTPPTGHGNDPTLARSSGSSSPRREARAAIPSLGDPPGRHANISTETKPAGRVAPIPGVRPLAATTSRQPSPPNTFAAAATPTIAPRATPVTTAKARIDVVEFPTAPAARGSVVSKAVSARTAVQPTATPQHLAAAASHLLSLSFEESVRPRDRLRRYATAGGAAVAINFILFGLAVALMRPADQVLSRPPGQFVQFVEYDPTATRRALPAPKDKGLFTADAQRASSAPPNLPFRNTASPALAPPPVDLAPAPRYDGAQTTIAKVDKPTVSSVFDAGASRSVPAAVAAGTATAGGGGTNSGTGGNGGARPAAARPAPALLVNAAPSFRVAPEYPAEALSAGLEGVVTIEFQIDGDGSVRDPRIVEAVPPGVFDSAALKAIKQWRYSAQADIDQLRRARQSMLFSLRH